MKKITKNSLFKLNLCVCASMVSTLMAYSGYSHSQLLLGESSAALELVPYTLQEKISVYKLANMSNLTIEQLNHLNTNMIRGRTTLSKGETIYLPANSELLGLATANTKKTENITTQAKPVIEDKSITTPQTANAPVVNSSNENSTEPTVQTAVNSSSRSPTAIESTEMSELSAITSKEVPAGLIAAPTGPTELNEKLPTNPTIPVDSQELNASISNNLAKNQTVMTADLSGNTQIASEIEKTPNSVSSSAEAVALPSPILAKENAIPAIDPKQAQLAASKKLVSPISPEDYDVNLPNLGSEENNQADLSKESPIDESKNIPSIISNQVEALANQFGNAQISINANENFDYKLSEFKFLTDIIQTNNSIFFTQFGITHQKDIARHNAISHLGFGYRHDLESMRLGVNTFVDSDLKNMSRLSVGGELRTDYLSFSTNYYTPLDGWSSATSDETFLISGAKQKPAKGIDVNMKGYLPNYPQIGGGLSFEQYFGDNIALFGTDNIDTDPFAVKASIDYMPIPLITANASHRIGENNVHDSAFGIDLNYRFGLSFEDQINPNAVAKLRNMSGSRFDFVDRNYEIVFEYKAQASGVNISSPTQAFVNQIVQIETEIDGNIKPESYLWLVKTPTSAVEYSEKDLSLELTQEGNYQVQLQIKTQNNETKISNIIDINSTFAQSDSIVLEMVKDEALALPDVNAYSDLTSTHVVLNLRSANQSENHAISIPSLEWKDSSGEFCQGWCSLNQSNELLKAEVSPSSQGGWEIKISGSEKLVDSQLQFRATSTVNSNRILTESNTSAKFF
ncbi:inverse autotransporter beta domain-containing protein [Thorsellia kenyensis]|uniref:Inverse autotransporter beta domain-containing protein n=1 Tax=Thorsellia kenyensis TaxID=1549888 RepID=A0ABV6CB66_9GAMM